MNFKNASNNEAEYEALLHGMRMAQARGATRLQIYGDSQLVVQQTMKRCDVIRENMAAYRDMYDILEANFDGCELYHIGRASNEEADALANISSTRAPRPPGVFLEQINERSIKIPRKTTKGPRAARPKEPTTPEEDDEPTLEGAPEQVMLIEDLWTRPFIAYLRYFTGKFYYS